MKKCAILFNLALVITLIGCGGGQPKPPPCPLAMQQNPADQQALQILQSLAQQTQSSCAGPGANSMGPLIPYISFSAGLLPNGMMSMPSSMPQLPPLAGGCQNTMTNFMLQFMTMLNGQYPNQPGAMGWFVDQAKGLLNAVGGSLLSQYPQVMPALLNNPNAVSQLYQAGWQVFNPVITNNPQISLAAPTLGNQICGAAGVPCNIGTSAPYSH